MKTTIEPGLYALDRDARLWPISSSDRSAVLEEGQLFFLISSKERNSEFKVFAYTVLVRGRLYNLVRGLGWMNRFLRKIGE